MTAPQDGRVERAAARFYRGLWKVIVDVLKVPSDGPSLPAFAGEDHAVFHPAPGFLRWLKFWFWLACIAIDLVLLAFWIAIVAAEPAVGIALAPVFLVVMVVPDVVAYVALHLRYDATWYVLTPRSVHIRRGIFVIHEVTITFANVQNLRLRSGPLQQYFGIADLIVETAGAGTDHQGNRSAVSNQGLLEGIADAETIRDLIMARVRKERGAGLGDEAATFDGGGGQPARWSPAHLAALREIRDGVAAFRSPR